MFKTSKEIVYECYIELAKEMNLDVEPRDEMEISRDSGFDSLGFVTFVIALEERTGLELDNYLSDIREAKKLKDIIDLIEKVRNINN